MKPEMCRLKRIAAMAALALLAWPTLARVAEGGHPLSLWQVAGGHNREYLLGSIHLLREADYPIPSRIYDAYADAESMLMEIDMDDVDPQAMQALTRELGVIADGRQLADLMGPDRYAHAETLAESAGVPLHLLASAEPWFAAMNVEIMMLMRMGFDTRFGIESHLMELAQKDGKDIAGFETLREQLEFLDGLTLEAQREMLLQALEESGDLETTMDGMIAAWRNGDTDYLEKNLLTDMQEYPELNRVIVTDRNLAWTGRIESLLDDDDDYLVVVGTLHLVGEHGVPALLRQRGHRVTQLAEPGE